MKSILRPLAVAGALVLMATTGAFAEWKPSGPITMMIGFAAGGGADTQARMIAEELEKAPWLDHHPRAGYRWRRRQAGCQDEGNGE